MLRHRQILESVYMGNMLNLRKLLQILVESTGVNLMWCFFQKMRGSPPKKYPHKFEIVT